MHPYNMIYNEMGKKIRDVKFSIIIKYNSFWIKLYYLIDMFKENSFQVYNSGNVLFRYLLYKKAVKHFRSNSKISLLYNVFTTNI